MNSAENNFTCISRILLSIRTMRKSNQFHCFYFHQLKPSCECVTFCLYNIYRTFILLSVKVHFPRGLLHFLIKHRARQTLIRYLLYKPLVTSHARVGLICRVTVTIGR